MSGFCRAAAAASWQTCGAEGLRQREMVPGARLWSLRLLLLGNATCDATMCGRLQQRAGPRADSPKAEQRSAKRAEHSKTASIYCAPAVLLLRCEIGSSTGRAGLPGKLAASDCRTAAGTQPPPGKEQQACAAGSGVCELNLHSTTRRTPISGNTAVQGPALCCGAGVPRAFRSGATSEVASAAISVINQRALRPPPTETAPARRHNDFR